MEGDVFGNHWDLGSIPRSTQNPISFFLMRLCVGSKRKLIMHLTDPHAKCLQGQIQRLEDGEHRAPGQPMLQAIPKSKQAWSLLGQFASPNTSNLAHTPIGFYFFFLFSFSFYYFFFSNYYYYYLINLNYFFHKIQKNKKKHFIIY